MSGSLPSLRNVQNLVLKRLVPSKQREGTKKFISQRQRNHAPGATGSSHGGTSMKILEKAASNLGLMIRRTLPGRNWGVGEANGGM